MDKDNNNKNEASNEKKPVDKTIVEKPVLSQEGLDEILKEHKKWLESDCTEGSRGDLRDLDLTEINLLDVNLSHAYFDNAYLKEADLSGGTFQKTIFNDANLKNTNFSNTDLKGASFKQANLIEAKLIKAKLQKTIFKSANLEKANLSGSELNGANLSRANMQNTILDGIQGFTDADLKYADLEGATGLLGHEFAQADVTGTKLPDDIKEFKALETVKETSQNARKIFFAMLLGCVYSWLTIATTTDVRLLTNTASSPLPIIQTEIPIAGFYWAAPLVLMCLYFYFHLYLLKQWEGLASLPAIFPDGKRLDERAYPWLLNGLVRRHFKRLKVGRPFIAYVQELITIFLAWWVIPITMIAFWLRYIPKHEWWGTCFHVGLVVVSVVFAIFFYRLCAFTLQGKEKKVFRLINFWRDRRTLYGFITATCGIMLILFSVYAFLFHGANFREKIVSEKPDNYWVISKDERLESVTGAKLKDANLKNADMFKAFMVKADCREAVLNDANLEEANLEKSNFENANLKRANLKYAILHQAELGRAKLQQADLYGVNLIKAKLWGAKLQEAKINYAKLQQANFAGAKLQQADFNGANLKLANLSEASLTGAKNLTIDQLSKVKTLYKAKLDPELMEQIKKCCPHLLEEPKEETDKKILNKD